MTKKQNIKSNILEEAKNLPDYPNQQNKPLIHRDVVIDFLSQKLDELEREVRNEEASRIFNKVLNDVADEHGLLEINQLLSVTKNEDVEYIDWHKAIKESLTK